MWSFTIADNAFFSNGDPVTATDVAYSVERMKSHALSAFVYRSDHRPVMLRRREWFERPADAFVVLWWVPADHIPTVDEAKARLQLLRDHGPGPEAFTFANPFPAPDG